MEKYRGLTSGQQYDLAGNSLEARVDQFAENLAGHSTNLVRLALLCPNRTVSYPLFDVVGGRTY